MLRRPWLKIVLLGVLLLGLYAGGVATRRHVLNAQRELTSDGSIPFTLESALAFRRIQMVYRDGALPAVDRGIQYPQGVVSREVDTIGVEKLYVRAAQLWPGAFPLAEKIRWLHLLWFCLAIPGMYFWVRWLGGGGRGGLWAAAFYAVAIAAVARSTGQELSHENNALPLLIWSMALLAWSRQALHWRGKMAGGWLAALLVGAALCAWDLIQFYLLLFLAWHLVEAIRGRLGKTELWTVMIPLMAILLAAGLRNPYLRSHGFLFSPAMALGWGMLLAGAPIAQRQHKATRVILGLLPLLLASLWAGLYLPAYSHFGSLLWAKLRFFNIRPTDPALLTFEQRILWAPALNSTSWLLLWQWFPALLVLTLAAIWGLLRIAFRTRCDQAGFFPLLFYFLVSFFTFILFFRFHVWVAIFGCGLVGLWAGQISCGENPRWRGVMASVLVCGLLLEAAQPWLGPLVREKKAFEAPEAKKWTGSLFWGRPNVYAAETDALMKHLRKYDAPEPVLANFGISAAIATYGGCPVVLHPKFESAAIRRKVREYGEALFKGDEAEFRDWMEAQGATIYVHSMGEFAAIEPGLQMRYMVDALDPATNVAARLFEQRPEELQFFAPEFANRKYRVYRLKQSPVAARLAETLAERARIALENGQLAPAELQAAHALRMDADNTEAQAVLRHADALRQSGFRAEEEDWFEEEADPLAPAKPW